MGSVRETYFLYVKHVLTAKQYVALQDGSMSHEDKNALHLDFRNNTVYHIISASYDCT